jgi:uncharacterized repeat protein (TIGR01451 family)
LPFRSVLILNASLALRGRSAGARTINATNPSELLIMAGRIGLAAKLFLGTTVLAGGGTGAWYATSHGLPTLAGDTTEVAATDDTASENTTNLDAKLDAVASAWAEPVAHTLVATDEVSPVARSANVEPASPPHAAPPKEEASQPVDRYAVVTPSDPATEVEEETETQAESAAEDSAPETVDTTPEVAPQVAEVEPAPVETAAKTDEPEMAEVTAPTEPVARGQEPSDTPSTPNASQFANELADTKPASKSSDRAREAFRDTTVTPTGDRYGSAPVATDAAAETGNKQQGVVNPFANKQQNNAPASAAASSSDLQRIEPLPGSPSDRSGQLTELQQDLPEPKALEPTRMSRATSATDVDHFGGSDQISDSSSPSESSLGNGFGNKRDALPPATPIGPTDQIDGSGKPGERALEGPQRPALEIQKFAPAEIQVGKPAKFVVQVKNVGTQAAESVTVRDVVPQGTRLISTTPTAETEGGQVVWTFDKLSPGEDRTVEMQLMPTEEGEIGSVATVSYTAQASVKTKCTMPQLAIRMTAPAKVMVGQQQRVKIELRNPGSGDATGVMLFENVPPNVKHVAGPALEFEIGTLRAGETRELELVLTAEKAGKTINVLSAKADGNLQVQQQVEFEIVAPELTVDLNGPERRYLERPATYEVSVENPGTAPAHDVQIVTKLPKGMRFIRANNMGEYDAATHAVYWSLSELPEGEKGTVELVAMPTEAGPQTLAVESRAGQGLSDQTQRQIVVDGLAAIMFEVRDMEDPIEVGGETGYEIRVVNQGTKAATNVQVGVKLPAGMQLVSAEGETQHKEMQGAIVFEPLEQLAAKADTVYRVRVQGTAAGDQRVTVEVNTDDLAQPIRREESTLVYGDE